MLAEGAVKVSFTLATASIPERVAPFIRFKIEPLQRREVQMVRRVEDLVDRDLFAAMILQGIVIHEGIVAPFSLWPWPSPLSDGPAKLHAFVMLLLRSCPVSSYIIFVCEPVIPCHARPALGRRLEGSRG